MGYYMVQAAYTAEALATLVKNPQNRLSVIASVAERLGGKVENAWMSFGEYDVLVICRMPDNASAAAFSFAAGAGGALKAIKTTPLLTIEEGIDVMKNAAKAGYQPPK
jgi:uncharacterized protein with GYD domain